MEIKTKLDILACIEKKGIKFNDRWVSVNSVIEELEDIVDYAEQKQDKHKNGYPTFKLHIGDLIDELKGNDEKEGYD